MVYVSSHIFTSSSRLRHVSFHMFTSLFIYFYVLCTPLFIYVRLFSQIHVSFHKSTSCARKLLCWGWGRVLVKTLLSTSLFKYLRLFSYIFVLSTCLFIYLRLRSYIFTSRLFSYIYILCTSCLPALDQCLDVNVFLHIHTCFFITICLFLFIVFPFSCTHVPLKLCKCLVLYTSSFFICLLPVFIYTRLF